MALMFQLTAIGIEKVELHTAELGALATIGTATKAMLGGVAESAVTDAQGTMNEDLQLYVGHGTMDGNYLVDGEFASQHYPTETQ